MFKKTVILSISIFLIFMFLTPIVKNKTRIIEKNIAKLKSEIYILEKQLIEAEVDYTYLSNPSKLKENLSKLQYKEYLSFDSSRFFLSSEDFFKYYFKQAKKTN
tara:strand:+ start:166 stop:477 length:312 start_codon:yes stop_codon:yes gene_type:complete